MGEPVTLYKGSKAATVYSPSDVVRMVAEGWQREPAAEPAPEPVDAPVEEKPKPAPKPKGDKPAKGSR